MLNLEMLGGVDFKKGCYPGQEIVARTQYRAKTKRRMHLAHSPESLFAGMPVYASNMGDQSAGDIVNAAPSPAGGWDALAVLHPEAPGGSLHAGASAGPALDLRAEPDGAKLLRCGLPQRIELRRESEQAVFAQAQDRAFGVELH